MGHENRGRGDGGLSDLSRNMRNAALSLRIKSSEIDSEGAVRVSLRHANPLEGASKRGV